MAKTHKKHSYLLQVILIVAIFLGFSWFQTRSLIKTGGEAPAFSLNQFNSDKTVSLKSLNGKPTVLIFWAPWCGVCKMEAAMASSLHEAYKDKANVYTVALDYQNQESIQSFITETGLTAPVLVGERTTALDYKINTFPTLYMLDEHGKITHHTVGYTTEWGVRLRMWIATLW